jgi:RHS repeat-associated protein
VDYSYAKVGNFFKKTDYSVNSSSAYSYGGSTCLNKPNAVCQLDKLNGTTVYFQYDNRGNLRVGDGLTMTYNAMDKPLTIIGIGAETGFIYGSDGMRAKQTRSVSGVNTSTYYVDKYYEVDSDGSWRAYLDDIAVLSYTPARQHLLHFTLRDRLGSGTTMADQNGVVISRRYFDPFGKTTTQSPSASLLENIRRMTYDLDIAKMQDLDVTNKNRRGFTDHEHLNEQQLIHMNGRVYDYNLGRFMSVDPLIQAPTSTQSVNPYSYIMNNPLAGTDPTGYEGEAVEKEAFTGSRIKREASAEGGSITAGSSNLTFNGNVTSFISVKFNGIAAGAGDVSKVGSLEGNSAKGGGSGINVENDSSLTAANNMAGQSTNNLTTEEKFFSKVIQPTLKKLGVNDPDAEVLLLGTAIHESHLTMRDQMGKGPAKGLYQMEPATHDDIWNNYLKYQPKLANKVKGLLSSNDKISELRNNDFYATAMAYVHYDRARFRTDQDFPSGTNIQGMAEYWKMNYNTSRGKGTVTKFDNDWWNATTKP